MITWLLPHRTEAEALAPAATRALCQAVLDSPYLAQTDLNSGFSGTYGFSFIFRRTGLPQAVQIMPELQPYLDKVLLPQANAFFLNPLLIRQGAGVAAHADKTLRSWTQPDEPPFPLRVSVLYLQVPAALQGGELIFRRFGLKLVRIQPRFNTLVEFAGHILHEVTPMSNSAEEARISLVCEQYQLQEDLLELVPEFSMDSTRAFDDFLEAALEGDESPLDETPAASDTGM